MVSGPWWVPGAVLLEHSPLEPSCLCKPVWTLAGEPHEDRARETVRHSRHASWGPRHVSEAFLDLPKPSPAQPQLHEAERPLLTRHGAEEPPAKPCTRSWCTESWETDYCFRLPSFEVVQGSNRNTFHNEHPELVTRTTGDLWVRIF